MKYNLLISDLSGTFNILNISEEQLQRAIKAYKEGSKSLTVSGDKYIFNDIDQFKIYTFEVDDDPDMTIKYYKNNTQFRIKQLIGSYLPERTLSLMGKNVTDKLIGDSEYGELIKKPSELHHVKTKQFINLSRIDELRHIKSDRFDLIRLIKLCEEMNDNYSHRNFMTVAIIGRAILDHIPPIFNFETFENFANNYGGAKNNKSIKKVMQHLNGSLRNIADKFLHQVVRNKESLPTENQIDFSQDLDVLLEEIVRVLK